MMPPTSIDGTDITGATIDGQDVEEITVDGQTVFSAVPTINFPVAYSNLVAWYPFDSATYGGSNADDVTAILGGSGDDTDYDGTVNGATYQSSGGVTDIRAGANSGAFDFDGSNDIIDIGIISAIANSEATVCGWIKPNLTTSRQTLINLNGPGGINVDSIFMACWDNGELLMHYAAGGSRNQIVENSYAANTYVHMALTRDSSDVKFYKNGSQINSRTDGGAISSFTDGTIGSFDSGGASGFMNGEIDDVRIYNTALTSSQINQIYQNTQP